MKTQALGRLAKPLKATRKASAVTANRPKNLQANKQARLDTINNLEARRSRSWGTSCEQSSKGAQRGRKDQKPSQKGEQRKEKGQLKGASTNSPQSLLTGTPKSKNKAIMPKQRPNKIKRKKPAQSQSTVTKLTGPIKNENNTLLCSTATDLLISRTFWQLKPNFRPRLKTKTQKVDFGALCLAFFHLAAPPAIRFVRTPRTLSKTKSERRPRSSYRGPNRKSGSSKKNNINDDMLSIEKMPETITH